MLRKQGVLSKMTDINCTMCGLCETRTNVVVGKGPRSSSLMIIGEAPGADEDMLAEPFIGRCGDLLTKMRDDSGVSRDNTYITNVVKCRPVQGKKNRAPSTEEIETCKRWLWEEMKVVNPRVILTLGKTPTGLLLKLKKTFKLADYINKAHQVEYLQSLVVPCYHPSYLMQTGRDKMGVALECIKLAKTHGI